MNGPSTITAAVEGFMMSRQTHLKRHFHFFRLSKPMAVLAVGLLLSGCGADQTTDYFDPSAELTKDEFKQGMGAQAPTPSPPPPPIPELQAVISAPALSPEISSRRVTVTVTETTPLKDVLIELAREARIGLELDPRIEGGVIFSAYDRPFDQVLRRLSDLAGLRFKLSDGVMRIELDDPYHVNYKLGYLSIVRSAVSEVSTESSVVGGDDEGGTGGGGASSSTVSSVSQADFWTELSTNLTQILTNTATRSGLVALQPDPVAALPAPATPAAAEPAAAPVANNESAAMTALSSATGGIAAVQTPTAAPTAAPTAGGVVLATPIAASATGAAIPSLTPAFAAASSLFTVNRQAGIVSVFGTERQHRQVETYLHWLRKSIGAQVLIEAKILEVTLDDEFRFGVNWAMLQGGLLNAAAPFNTATTPTIVAPPFSQLIGAEIGGNAATANVLTLGLDTGNLDIIVNVVERFGTVRALSSPRLTVMQNQTAVLKVAEEQVFFTQEVTPGIVGEGGLGTDNVVTSQINTVTVGLIMTVQPSINLETDEITLTLRPTITRVVSTEQDPAQTAASLIPELGIQEIDSVVTIPSGHVIIMGGLMQDRTTVTEFGIPLLSDIPWIGQAFKSTDRDTRKTELVIFLRATIVRNDSVDAYDIKLYDQFGQDRRPLVFD